MGNYKRMFSKVISRASQYQQLSSLQSRAFRASAIANSKKPSIGDAVTILQSKVSGINQVVSIQLSVADALSSLKRLAKMRCLLNRKSAIFAMAAHLIITKLKLTMICLCPFIE